MQRDRLGVPPDEIVPGGEVVAGGERRGVVGPELRLHPLDDRLEQRDRLGVPPDSEYAPARLLRLASVIGWSAPSFDSASLSAGTSRAVALSYRSAEVGGGEVVAAPERVGVVGAELRFPLLERRLVARSPRRPFDGP